jgi:cyclophilin family peptidyl-prolyl cis-trans isomerase
MKKLFTFVALIMAIFLMGGCSAIKKMNRDMEAVKYNNIKATFVTSQGDINLYLYPEAAPVTVVNFINLAKRGYYDNNKIHRAVDNFIVQAGDPTETGTGGPGYAIPDEAVEWLDFYQAGMLAMANAGPGTAGSQYFFTLYAAEWLNGKHTIFGEYVSDEDFETMRKLEYGDLIKEVKFTGEVDFLLSIYKGQVEKWNEILDEKFPDMKKYPIKNPEEFQGEVAQYREELERIYTVKEQEKDEDKESFVPKFIRSVEKKLKKDDNQKVLEESGVVNSEEVISSPNSLEIEKIDNKNIEELDNLDNNEESFWQKLKFWK